MKVIDKKLPYFILATILLVGFFLRAQETLSGNYLFLLDQGRDMMDVRAIVIDHNLTLIGPYTSLQGVFQGPLWYYLIAVTTFIFRGDPWGGILLMLLISMSILGIVFLWAKRLFGVATALIITFLFAFSSEAIAAATYAWNPHPMWLLILVFIFSFYEVIRGNQKFHFLLWPTLSLMFHFQTALGVFITGASILFILFFERKIIRQKNFLISIIIASLFFLPQVLFDLRNDFLMSRSLLGSVIGENRGLGIGGEDLSYKTVIKGHASSFYYNFESGFMRGGFLQKFPPVMLFLTIIFAPSILRENDETSKFFKFLLIFVGLVLVVSFLYPFPIRYWFLIGFQSFFLLITGIMLGFLWQYRVGKFTIILGAFILVYYSGLRIHTLYFNPPNDGGFSKMDGKKAAIDYIYKEANGKQFNVQIFTPPVITDAYDYMFLWYGLQKYGYIPGRDLAGNVYLLMEPDPEKPWSYEGWLETVIREGEVVKTATLSSGLVIQQRRFD